MNAPTPVPLPPMQALIARSRLLALAEEIRKDIAARMKTPPQRFYRMDGGQ